MDKDTLIQVFRLAKQWRGKKNDDWKKRHIVWVFWNNDYVSELCEKWINLNYNYVYTRFQQIRTRSGKVILTREHKATISNDRSNAYIGINELKMLKDFSTSDKTTFKTKDMLDKINNKISVINKYMRD